MSKGTGIPNRNIIVRNKEKNDLLVLVKGWARETEGMRETNVLVCRASESHKILTVSSMFSNFSQSKPLHKLKCQYVTNCVGGPNMTFIL